MKNAKTILIIIILSFFLLTSYNPGDDKKTGFSCSRSVLLPETGPTCAEAGGHCSNIPCNELRDCSALTGSCTMGYCCSGTCEGSADVPYCSDLGGELCDTGETCIGGVWKATPDYKLCCTDGYCGVKETDPPVVGDHVFRLAHAFYASSSFTQDQVNFMNENLELGVFHEPMFNSLQNRQFPAILYKVSAIHQTNDYVGVCCYSTAQSHDDWFLHCGGSKCFDSFYNIYLTRYDSDGWIDYSINDINADIARTGADGLFYDALQITRGELYFPDEYSTDQQVFDDAMYIMEQLYAGVPGDFWINGAPYNTGGTAIEGGPERVANDMMVRSDGFMDESLCLNWAGGWYPNDILRVQLGVMDAAEDMQKEVTMLSLFRYTTSSNYENIIAFYLLGANDYTYFSFNYEGYNYGSFYRWVTGNQDLINTARALGKPTGSRTQDGSVYTRMFENGRVTFNTNTHEGAMILD